MSEFDEFVKGNFKNLTGSTKAFMKEAYEAGQQSQQTKIDELQLEAINVNNEFYANGQKSMRKIMQGRVDELQARVDEALKQLDLAYPESWGYCVDEAINILKGNKDEN